MQKSPCSVLGIGPAVLLMLRYKAVRTSAAHLGTMMRVAPETLPRRLHHGDYAVLLPAAMMETFVLLHPYEETLGSVADVFLRLKAAIEQRALASCSAPQQRLIEAEYRRIASEIRRKAHMILPAEVRRAAKSELRF